MRTAYRVTALSLLAGLPVGVLWWWVSPLPRAVKRADGVFYAQSAESAIAADGWFAVCSVVVGAWSGLLVALLARAHRLHALAALALGGLGGAVLAWQLGQWLGPAAFLEQAQGLRVGTSFDGPLRLSALGVLMVWPIAAVIVFFGVVAGIDSVEDDRRPGEVSPLDAAGPSARR